MGNGASTNQIKPISNKSRKISRVDTMIVKPEHRLTTNSIDSPSSSSTSLAKYGVDTTLYDRMTDVIIISDLHKKIMYVNGAVTNQLAYIPRRLLRKSILIFFPLPIVNTTIRMMYAENLRTHDVKFKCVINGDVGTSYWAEIHMIRTHDLVFIVMRDITIEIQLQKMLDQKTKQHLTLEHILQKVFHARILQKIMNDETEFLDEHTDLIVATFDIVDYTTRCVYNNNMFTILRNMYVEIDRICLAHNLFIVEIIGDAMIVVGNLFPEVKNRVNDGVNFLLETIKYVQETTKLDIRCGMAMGRAKSGMIGGSQLRFHVFGNVVNKASRMESIATKNTIRVTNEIYDAMETKNKYKIKNEGVHDVKSYGKINTWTVTAKARRTQSSRVHHRTLSVPMETSFSRALSVSDLTTPLKITSVED
jgi:class 3 adenylate cyclase